MYYNPAFEGVKPCQEWKEVKTEELKKSMEDRGGEKIKHIDKNGVGLKSHGKEERKSKKEELTLCEWKMMTFNMVTH